MVFAQSLGAAAGSAVTPVVMGGVALAGDFVMRADFKLPEIKVPKIKAPELKVPELKLPSLGKPAAAPKKEKAIFIDDNPNAPAAAPRKPAPAGNVQVRVASPQGGAPEAPTLADLKKDKAPVIIGNPNAYRAFPGRRMPGANMESFLDMAKEYETK